MNALSGLGGAKDKRTFARFEKGTDLDEQTLEDLYHYNDLAATICEACPEDALRRGIVVKIKDDPDRATAIQMRLDELQAIPLVTDTATWGNVFGGAALLLGIDQGDMSKPLDIEKSKGLKYLTVLDRRDITPQDYYANPLAPKFGQPETYTFTNYLSSRQKPGDKSLPVGQKIHETRLVFFWGARTSKRVRIQNKGWPHSKLQKVYDVIRDFEMGWAGASLLLQEASQSVYGVDGLLDIIASEQGQETLEKRMQVIEMSRSVARSLIIDSKLETFERKPVQFTNVPDMLDRFCQRLSAACHIPITRLMGISPGGLGQNGDSDQRNWNKQVKSYQEQELKPALELIVLALLLETGGEPKQWSVEFPSLNEPTQKEEAEIRKLVADTDSVYITAQVYTPEECAMSRFTADGWSMETTIDLELREELAGLEKENQLTLKEDPPELQEQEGKRKELDAPPEPENGQP